MNPETFFDKFGMLADTPNGVQKLRELILQLAVQGKLVPQDENDEPAAVLLEKIKAEKARLVKEKKIRKLKPLSPIEVDEYIFEIPKGWEWVHLGSLGQTQTGTTPSKNNPAFFGDDYPFIKPSDISHKCINCDNKGLSNIGIENGRFIKSGSILMVCIGGSIGKVNWIDKDCSCNQQINVLTPFLNLDYKLFTYFMTSRFFQNEVIIRASKTTLPILNKSKWELIPFPLPPLNEQKRIVAKVDQLMALCGELEARQHKKQETRLYFNSAALDKLLTAHEPAEFANHWQRICDNFDLLYDNPETVGELRKAILQLAVQGKLVRQDANDEPAAVLLERIKAEKERLVKEKKIKKVKQLPDFEDGELPYELPNEWLWARIDQIANSVHYGYTASANYELKDIRLLRITDIQNGRVNWDNVPGCEIDEKIVENYRLYEGDLLIARTGGTIGKSYLVEKPTLCAVFASYIIRVIPNSQSFPNYLKIFLESPLYWKQLYEKSMGTGQPNVNGTSLRALILPLPPLQEQRRIVAKVDQLMALCDELETKLKQSQTDGAKLMEAVVHQLVAT